MSFNFTFFMLSEFLDLGDIVTKCISFGIILCILRINMKSVYSALFCVLLVGTTTVVCTSGCFV